MAQMAMGFLDKHAANRFYPANAAMAMSLGMVPAGSV